MSVRGTTVQLDGRQSYDPDGDPITFAWTLLQKPTTSTATLLNATSSTPTFVADVPEGDYLVQLVVRDSFGAVSEPDTVLVSFANVPPVADAGDTQTVLVGATVGLDGSGSADANGDPLTFRWSITEMPIGSQAALDDSTAVALRFVANAPGTYTTSLIVNDGLADSQPSSVTIVAITRQTQITQTLETAIETINGLDAVVFQNDNLRRQLTNKIATVIGDVANQTYEGALQKLKNDVLSKLDGCMAYGKPDQPGNDWIIDCGAQAQVYPLIIEAITLLESLLLSLR